MNKKNIAIAISISIVILYIIATVLGFFSMGVLSVYTDKKEYEVGEKITINIKNSGITLLAGVPKWEIYKINDHNETLVFWNEIKGPEYIWPQGYFGLPHHTIWDPSKIYTHTGLEDVGPQKEGTYRVVAMVRTGGGFNTSSSTIITING
ncbi:MAG: hypothetical protein K0A89_07825 [ANME-2 cluster archaeon]|nr:hypothetical protein [ANME-2 cluster archaeon]